MNRYYLENLRQEVYFSYTSGDRYIITRSKFWDHSPSSSILRTISMDNRREWQWDLTEQFDISQFSADDRLSHIHTKNFPYVIHKDIELLGFVYLRDMTIPNKVSIFKPVATTPKRYWETVDYMVDRKRMNFK